MRREEIVGRNHNEVLPDDNPLWVQVYGQVALTGQPVHIENYSPALKRHYEVFAYRPAPRQFAVLFVDITERKQMEEALRSSETRYRRLFETAQDGILILDAETGQIIDVNPFLTEMLGYSHKDFIGRKLWEIGAFEDIGASKVAFIELQSKGYVRYEDLPLETRDERHIAVEFVSNVYSVNHKRVIQCNIRDITFRKRIEEERRKLIHDLQVTLAKVKRLRGLLPICASCKKIRDDKGYWNELEAYISEHSEAEITHGFCPDCMKRLYGVVLDEDTDSKTQ
jgi:PAS domain S-box-containing protein